MTEAIPFEVWLYREPNETHDVELLHLEDPGHTSCAVTSTYWSANRRNRSIGRDLVDLHATRNSGRSSRITEDSDSEPEAVDIKSDLVGASWGCKRCTGS